MSKHAKPKADIDKSEVDKIVGCIRHERDRTSSTIDRIAALEAKVARLEAKQAIGNPLPEWIIGG